ncbi:RNA-directed DNA polymerase, eukaryota, reverse transcriptase zinc-binding domain protein [Tanacetum coccineum]
MPIFHMSLFKVPSGILHKLESIRKHFFNGHEVSSRKISWVNWNKVISPKEKGGLGVSSLYALNRGLLFKWVWRFLTQGSFLWARVIKAIHGMDGSIGNIRIDNSKSCWSSIINEINVLSSKGIKLMNYLRITLGNGVSTRLWDEPWHVEGILKDRFPRIYALENCKSVTVGDKLAHQTLSHSFGRLPRGGIENAQFAEFSVLLQQVVLAQGSVRWTWTENGSGQFSVASVRKIIDNKLCSGGENSTRWIRCVPNKINIHAWKVMTEPLATRFDKSRRGIVIESILCGNCDIGVETTSHLFFTCDMATSVHRLINRWWEVPDMEIDSYATWKGWIVTIRMASKTKLMFEGVYYVMWWLLWWYRNKKIFEGKSLIKAMFLDDVISKSKFLNLENVNQADYTLTTIMDTSAQPTSSLVITTTPLLPPPPHHATPPNETTTSAPTTQEPQTSAPDLLDFASIFKFNERIFNLEQEVSQLKQDNKSAQISESIKSQVPVLVDEHLSTRVGYAVQTTFHSYKLDKDLFDTYGEAYSLKRDRDDKDKDEDPSGRSDRGKKRRKSGKEAEPSQEPKSRSSKSTSSSKGPTQSPCKSSGKSAHAKESRQDSGEPHDQEFVTGNTDDQPAGEAISKDDWWKKPEKTPTPDHDRGRQVILVDYFINNDLLYLQGGSASRKYTTSTTKTKVATYDNVLGIEDMIPNLWSSTKFKEGDFPRLNLRDIEDLLLLLVQKKISNLENDVLFDLNVALWMFTRRIVILKRVEDLQLGVESYQKKLNITKPQTFKSGISKLTPYTAFNDPPCIIYQDRLKRNRLMRLDELYKFCDGSLTDVRSVLDDIAKNRRMEYLPKRDWSRLYRMFERRLMRNLERFVGEREYGNDFRLLERTI